MAEAGPDQTNQKFILRRATEADIPAIREVARLTWEDTYAQSVFPENRARVIAASYSDGSMQRTIRRSGRDTWFWVAAENADTEGSIVGFGEVILRTGLRPDAELTRIYILPAWQGQGIGKALVEALLADLRALRPGLRPPRLHLSVATHNRSAIAFYERRGFQHERSFQANLPGQMLDMQEYVIEV